MLVLLSFYWYGLILKGLAKLLGCIKDKKEEENSFKKVKLTVEEDQARDDKNKHDDV